MVFSDASTPEAVKQKLLLSFSGILHKQGGIYVYGKDFIQKAMSIAGTSQNVIGPTFWRCFTQ